MRVINSFTSLRERRLWLLAFTVFLVIFSTLFFGGQVIRYMVERRVLEQCTFFLFLFLVVTFVGIGWVNAHRKSDILIYIGVIILGGMALLRMDLTTAERSHMFEYGLLAIIIYEALRERKRNNRMSKSPVWLAIWSAGSIGFVDEVIQVVIPYRVFDPIDIAFNIFAATFGVLICYSVGYLKRIFIS